MAKVEHLLLSKLLSKVVVTSCYHKDSNFDNILCSIFALGLAYDRSVIDYGAFFWYLPISYRFPHTMLIG